MQQDFLSIPQDTWNIIFLVIRYVVVALVLAYFANVYVKRKDIRTDIKGRVLEWRVETYKRIHRWVMAFQSVIAAPSQDEEHYRNLLASTRFKIGYQGMEYATFFDTPERLFKFGMEFSQMMNKEEDVIDYSLRHELNSFQYWLDDVILIYGAFGKTECDKRWKFSKETIDRHCKLACKVLGIALQEDVNRFYHKIDEILRDRLRNVKIAGVYTESWLTKWKRKVDNCCERVIDKEKNSSYGRSQLVRNHLGLMKIFILIHYEELFAHTPAVMKDQEEVSRLTTEFYDCYTHNLER